MPDNDELTPDVAMDLLLREQERMRPHLSEAESAAVAQLGSQLEDIVNS